MLRNTVKFKRDYIHRFYSDSRLREVHSDIQLGNYLSAVNTLKTKLINLKESRDWLFAYAICMRKLGYYGAAVTAFEKALVKYGQYDFYVALELIKSYQKIGRDDRALTLFRLIPDELLNDDAHLIMTKYFLNRREFSAAKDHIKRISTHSEHRFQLAKAKWYENGGHFSFAEETLSTSKVIPFFARKIELAKIYGKQGRLFEQRKLLDVKFNKPTDIVKAQLMLARRHESLCEYPRAALLYAKLIKDYPSSYAKVLPALCRHYIESNHPDALAVLNNALLNFPDMQSLYLLKARYFDLHDCPNERFAVLAEANERFPCSVKITTQFAATPAPAPVPALVAVPISIPASSINKPEVVKPAWVPVKSTAKLGLFQASAQTVPSNEEPRHVGIKTIIACNKRLGKGCRKPGERAREKAERFHYAEKESVGMKL